MEINLNYVYVFPSVHNTTNVVNYAADNSAVNTFLSYFDVWGTNGHFKINENKLWILMYDDMWILKWILIKNLKIDDKASEAKQFQQRNAGSLNVEKRKFRSFSKEMSINLNICIDTLRFIDDTVQ